MKKIFTLMVVALMLCATANAQIKFGVKGGLNLSALKLEGNVLDNVNVENQTGFFAGPTVKVTVPVVGVGFDVAALYSQRQMKINDSDIKQKSIAVPVNVRYSLPVLPVFIFAGPQFDFNIGDKEMKLQDLKVNSFKLKDSQLSVNAGIGVAFGSLQATVNYNIACGNTGEWGAIPGLSSSAGDIAAGISAITGNAKNNTWQIAVAYYF